MERQRTVVVIGAGFSGLMTGFYLVEKGFSVQFVEKKERVGGLLGSQSIQGAVVEQAANAFIATDELERVSEVIGVPLYSKKKEARKRYIFRNGRPRRWPLGFWASISVFLFLLRYVFFKKSLKPRSGQTLEQWGQEMLGAEATNFLISPAMQGVYATTADKLSASLILKNLFAKKKSRAGKLKGSVAPRGGMGEWVEGMKSYLESQSCYFSTADSWKGSKSEGPLVVATDFASAKKLLKEMGDPRVEDLQNIETLSLTSVTLHWEKDSSPVVSGFGCLFPQSENFNALGVLNNGDIFEGRADGFVSETWIFNDSRELVSEKSKEELIGWIRRDRERMGLRSSKLLSSQLFQWPRAIPHYGLEMEQRLKNLDLERENTFLMGNYLGSLGLSRLLTLASETAQRVSERGRWQKQQ